VVGTIAYFAILLAVLVYLPRCGGKTGRWAAYLQLSSWLASLIANQMLHGSPYLWTTMLSIDLASLCWKTALAIKSTRRWPIWMAAFQINTASAHLTILVPNWDIRLYYAMYTVWAMPSLLVMLIGTALDRRFDRKMAAATTREA